MAEACMVQQQEYKTLLGRHTIDMRTLRDAQAHQQSICDELLGGHDCMELSNGEFLRRKTTKTYHTVPTDRDWAAQIIAAARTILPAEAGPSPVHPLGEAIMSVARTSLGYNRTTLQVSTSKPRGVLPPVAPEGVDQAVADWNAARQRVKDLSQQAPQKPPVPQHLMQKCAQLLPLAGDASKALIHSASSGQLVQVRRYVQRQKPSVTVSVLNKVILPQLMDHFKDTIETAPAEEVADKLVELIEAYREERTKVVVSYGFQPKE